MKLSLLFGLLCVLCLGVYITLVAVGTSNPAILSGLSAFMIVSSWGAGAFFILALVMFVLRR